MSRRGRIVVAAIAAFLALSLVIAGRSPRAAKAGRVPARADEILERVDPSSASLSPLPGDGGDDVELAVSQARELIRRARATGDPRFLGRAEARLSRWWREPEPPVDVLVLRATIRQSLHAFDEALADLDQAARRAPGDPQVWVTRATVLTVVGRYDDARAACRALAPLADRLVAVTCLANVDGLTGQARAAHDGLAQVLATSRATPEVAAWVSGTLGELSERAGDVEAAERELRRALDADPEDAYVRGALADLYLDAARHADVVTLVRGREENDAMLLRLAIAERGAGLPSADLHVDALAARFAASRLRGDTVHRREEARFELLRGDASRALELARANFAVQKEVWDVRVLLEAAKAKGDSAAAAPALDHVQRTGLEHPRVRALVEALR